MVRTRGGFLELRPPPRYTFSKSSIRQFLKSTRRTRLRSARGHACNWRPVGEPVTATEKGSFGPILGQHRFCSLITRSSSDEATTLGPGLRGLARALGASRFDTSLFI